MLLKTHYPSECKVLDESFNHPNYTNGITGHKQETGSSGNLLIFIRSFAKFYVLFAL